MKRREGFVSNSSSSSFCILGIHKDDIRKSLKESSTENTDDYTYDEKLDEIFESIDYKSELTVESGISDYRGYFIGIEPSSIDENKTIKEVKQELAEKLSKLFNTKISSNDLGFYTDGGYEG